MITLSLKFAQAARVLICSRLAHLAQLNRLLSHQLLVLGGRALVQRMQLLLLLGDLSKQRRLTLPEDLVLAPKLRLRCCQLKFGRREVGSENRSTLLNTSLIGGCLGRDGVRLGLCELDLVKRIGQLFIGIVLGVLQILLRRGAQCSDVLDVCLVHI